jgi:hypothetical protein
LVFVGWVLDERNDTAGHEPGRAHRFAGARHLGHLDDAAPGGDLDPATRASRENLVGPGAVVRSDHDLDTIASHGASVPGPRAPLRPLASRERDAERRRQRIGGSDHLEHAAMGMLLVVV